MVLALRADAGSVALSPLTVRLVPAEINRRSPFFGRHWSGPWAVRGRLRVDLDQDLAGTLRRSGPALVRGGRGRRHGAWPRLGHPGRPPEGAASRSRRAHRHRRRAD